MTVREMINRFHARLDDYQKAYWNDTRSIALINTYIDKLAQEFVVNRTENYYEFSSVAGQQHYEVPSNLIHSHYLYFNSSYNREIIVKEGPRTIYGPIAAVTQQGIPQVGYIWGTSGRRQLTLYPTFNKDGLTLQWWFYGWPPEVSEDNDEPLLPIEWHPSIAEGIINQAKADDKMISIADNLLLWKDEVRKLKRLDVTKDIIEKGGQYGSIDGNFPRIEPGDGSLPFRIAGRGDVEGVIW